MKLNDYFGFIEDAICAGSKAGGSAIHGGVVGNAREALLRDFLSKTLGKSYIIGQGVILSATGEELTSKVDGGQFDVVIYDARFPLLAFSGQDKGFFLEGVRAWIEVKSQLTKADIEKAEERASIINGSQSVEGYVPAYLISLGGSRKLKTALLDLKNSKNITACCILNKWVAYHKDLSPTTFEAGNPPVSGNYHGLSENIFSLIMLNLFTKLLVGVPQGAWFQSYFDEIVFAEDPVKGV